MTGMGLPELLFLIGLILFFTGLLAIILAFSLAFLGHAGKGEGAGLVLVGPMPVLIAGRTTRLLLAVVFLMALVVFVIMALILLMGVGWT